MLACPWGGAGRISCASPAIPPTRAGVRLGGYSLTAGASLRWCDAWSAPPPPLGLLCPLLRVLAVWDPSPLEAMPVWLCSLPLSLLWLRLQWWLSLPHALLALSPTL